MVRSISVRSPFLSGPRHLTGDVQDVIDHLSCVLPQVETLQGDVQAVDHTMKLQTRMMEEGSRKNVSSPQPTRISAAEQLILEFNLLLVPASFTSGTCLFQEPSDSRYLRLTNVSLHSCRLRLLMLLPHVFNNS